MKKNRAITYTKNIMTVGLVMVSLVLGSTAISFAHGQKLFLKNKAFHFTAKDTRYKKVTTRSNSFCSINGIQGVQNRMGDFGIIVRMGNHWYIKGRNLSPGPGAKYYVTCFQTP